MSLPYLKELSLQKVSSSAKAAQHHRALKAETEREGSIQESSIVFVNRMTALMGLRGVMSSLQELVAGEQLINIRTETNKTLRSL